ncbi:putative site-specific integrase-resolvase [Saccharothrix ecbatanensis]|uniref:Putative site-specific integrase-resolvase n=1 Tax=Saccharothrix ecbatanensis TaxID=1105145 RepID=A0A7W9LZB7_9PSEU|nr:putative site-specific integrase-resolvase [Saccharothrix ecbatanensis]
MGSRTILVDIDANTSPSVMAGVGLYASVSTYDQKSDPERQVARLSEWSAKASHRVMRVESEIASFHARLYGRHTARNRAEKAPEAAATDD